MTEPHIYETIDGQRINLGELEHRYPESMKFLKENISEQDGTGFQVRTRLRIERVCTRVLGRTHWQSHPLAVLQEDLAKNLGIVCGQTPGTVTPSFLRFRPLADAPLSPSVP